MLPEEHDIVEIDEPHRERNRAHLRLRRTTKAVRQWCDLDVRASLVPEMNGKGETMIDVESKSAAYSSLVRVCHRVRLHV